MVKSLRLDFVHRCNRLVMPDEPARYRSFVVPGQHVEVVHQCQDRKARVAAEMQAYSSAVMTRSMRGAIILMPIVRAPTEAERVKAFHAYALALGKVVHAWNYLHERLGQVFVDVSGAEPAVALSIWNALSENERYQRRMLGAAIKADAPERWRDIEKLPADLLWLIEEIDTWLSRAQSHHPASYPAAAK